MIVAHPSRDLYAFASYYDSRARALAHQPDAHVPGRCAPWCERCRWEARARLYGRAGDAAASCADGGPASP